MKNKILFVFIIVAFVLFGQCGFAAETNNVAADLGALISKINAKLTEGKNTEADLTNEIRGFDVLYTKYKDAKAENRSQILAMKAKLYLEVIDAPMGDPEKAAEVFQQIKRDLPETEIGKRVDAILASLKQPIEVERIRHSLVVGIQFPDFDEKDLNGKPLSLANYKGKVVLIDFWATWCPPCIREVPNTLEVYKKYHDKGFEIIGVSLDEDRDRLEDFIKENDIPWPQFFDGQGRGNKLAVKYGADSPPTFYLLDRTGKIINIDRFPDSFGDLRGRALDKAVAKALAK